MQSPRILFIDENNLSLRSVENALENDGYSVACICQQADLPAGLAFEPDTVVFNPGYENGKNFAILDAMADVHDRSDLVLARHDNQEEYRQALAHARARNLMVLGGIDRPYRPKALERFCEARQTVRQRTDSTDAAHVARLIDDGRLIPNIIVDFQPIHSLFTGAVVGYEGLTRLATRRAISPSAIFTPHLDIGLEIEATAVVVDTCARLAALLAQGGRRQQVSFNCSTGLIIQTGLVDMVRAAIEKHRIAPHSLMIEITEQPQALDTDALIESCHLLYAHGVDIAIDDFGSKLSNLDRIAELPFQEIKIDKNVFWACCEGRLPMSILRDLLDFCRSTKRHSVIEGIETDAHLAQAKLLRADYGQGYYWGLAVPPQIFAPNWP